MELFRNFVGIVNTVLWDYVLIVGLVGVGIYMTIRLGFPQFKRVFPALGQMISDIKNKVPAPPGGMTPFQSLATSVAAQVGTGNIVGVASAIAAGGPGAAFWMLLSAFFGMASIYAEGVLAQVYRERDEDNQLVGGPAYYIKNGLKSSWLAKTFAVFAILGLGIVGIMVQSNSIVVSVNNAFGLPPIIITTALIVVVGWILVGGMDRIAGFSEKVVPLMAFGYIFASVLIIIINYDMIWPAIQIIFQGAFTPNAIGGGVLGIGIQESIRYGLSRGLFSNEAGMGSTPHSHAVATTPHPSEQGFVAMIGVFISTFLICMATVFINLTSGSYDPSIPAAEMYETANLMSQLAFESGFGTIGASFLSIALTSFSLTTIVGWYFFAESNVKFLTKNNFLVKNFKLVALFCIFLGMIIAPDFVWELADMMMGLMALPNIVAIFLLSNVVIKNLEDYDEKKLQGNLFWEYEYEDFNPTTETKP